MRKRIQTYAILIALLAFLAGSIAVSLMNQFFSNNQVSRELIEIVDQLNSATVNRDRERMAGFLSGSITIKASSAQWTLSKDELILQLLNANIQSIEATNYSTRIQDGKVSLNFDQEENMLHDNQGIKHQANYTYSFSRVEGCWKLVEIIRTDH